MGYPTVKCCRSPNCEHPKNGIQNFRSAFRNIRDSTLNYGHETVIETYYNAHLSKYFWLTVNYQFVNNPAYNKDRDPVQVFGVRAHIEF